MTWDALAAIGEIIGALAVVASLFYLAIQIRQNSRMMIANVRELRMGATQELIFKFAEDAPLIRKLHESAELSGDETVKAQLFVRAAFRNWESHLHQYQNGLFDEDEWSAVTGTMRFYLRVPEFRNFWRVHRDEFSFQLQNFLDSLLTEIAGSQSNVMGH